MDKLRLIWNNYNISEAVELLKNNSQIKCKITNQSYHQIDFETMLKEQPTNLTLFLNTELYQITISYQPKTLFWVFTLQINPNKIHRFLNNIKNPTDKLTEYEFSLAMNYIETELLNLGFNLSLENSKIREYHFCLDIETEQPYEHYFPIISQLAPPPKHRQEKGRFESSIYFKSKSSGITIYDKQKEWNMKEQQNPIEYNLVRFEFKQKTSIPYNEFNFKETSEKAYNRLIDLLNLNIQSDDILNSIITAFRSNDKSINRIATDLQKKLLLYFLKTELPKRDLTFDDIIPKELTPTEKVWKSKFKRNIISSDIYDPTLKELHQELQTKLKARFEL